MGSRYLFIVLYVFLEHHLTRGDYRRAGAPATTRAPHFVDGHRGERPAPHRGSRRISARGRR
jgi:dolichol-phosphate mannosyltransferase